jgi:hypothetical protein
MSRGITGRLSAKHKGRAVLSPDFRAVIRLPHHGINLFRQSSKFPFLAVGAKIQLGFSANRYSPKPKDGVDFLISGQKYFRLRLILF